MKTQAACVHASREEPCWGPLQVAVAGVVTCAGHYYVEATGGRYVAQGERHAFEKRIAAMREPVELLEMAESPRDIAYREMVENEREQQSGTVDLATIADLTED